MMVPFGFAGFGHSCKFEALGVDSGSCFFGDSSGFARFFAFGALAAYFLGRDSGGTKRLAR